MDPRKAKFDEITNELNNIFTHYETLKEIVNHPQAKQELTDLKQEINYLQNNVIFVVKPTDVASIKQLIDRFDNLGLDTGNLDLTSRLKQIDVEVNRLSNAVSSALNVASTINENKSATQPVQSTESTTKKESRRNEEKEYGAFGKMRDSFQAVKKAFKPAMKQLKESIQEKVDDFRPKSKR